MATRAKVTENLPETIVFDEPATLQSFSSADEEFEPEDLAIMNLLGELGNDADANVRVYRQGKGGYRDLTFLFECPPSEFSPTVLQDEPYNGGEFRIHAQSKGGFKANKLIRVAPRPGISRMSPAPDLTNVLAPMQQQISALAGLVEKIAMMGVQQQQPPVSRKDMLDEMLTMKQILGGGNQQNANPIEMLTQVIEVSRTLGGLGGGGSGESVGTLDVLMRAMEVFGKPMAEIMAAQKQNQAAGVVHQPVNPLLGDPRTIDNQPSPVLGNSPPVAGPVVEQAPPMNIEEQEAMNMFKMYFNTLIAEAQADSDPTGYAYMIANKAPQDMIDGLIRAPDWLDQLAKIDPRVKDYPDWFADLRDIVLEILTPEPGSAITSALQPTNNSGATNVSTPAATTNIKPNT